MSTKANHPEKRYPIRCAECGKNEVRPATVRHVMQKNHDGRMYDLVIEDLPVTKCDACGEIYFTNESDDRISASLRERLGVLSPEQIRANLESLGMNQKQLAECLGVAAETLSRWLNGSMIQSRSLDNLLRAYFGIAEVRANLTGDSMDVGFGAAVDPSADHTAELGRMIMLRAGRFLSMQREGQKMTERLDVGELLQSLYPMLSRPKAARSLSLWSRAVCQVIYGADPVSSQLDLFAKPVDEVRAAKYELLFEYLTKDFAAIPDPLQSRTFEAFSEIAHLQKNAVAAPGHDMRDPLEGPAEASDTRDCLPRRRDVYLHR
ncbi:MAG: type II TA system antitoxin MqsA family protein [Tepidisphaeraceae bacterium]